MLDIFRSDAFSVVSLTDAINALDFVPGRIDEMGLFASSSVNTISIAIEEKDGILVLVSPSPRGGPGATVEKSKRRLRSLTVPHFEINDAIMAEEVQGVRAWGQETALETVQDKVAERGMIHSQSMEATREFSRIGAIKGVITYADASELNLFTSFEVSQLTEVNFDLDNASAGSGALRKKCAAQTRAIAVELGGLPFSEVRAFCGDNFFDDLLAHPEVRETFIGWNEAKILREGYIEKNGKSYGAFEFGGIVWENYRGSVGGTGYINTDKCHIYPVGVPNLFRSVMAPADYIETVNTMGQRLYAKQYPMPNGKGVHLDVQMNSIEYCTRPRVLIKGKRT